MKPMISPRAMRECELNYFRKSGIPSIDVMERAARALADAVTAEVPAGARIHFACGSGGNGGDGTACARLLSERYDCTIVQPASPASPDASENLRRAQEAGIPVLTGADALPVPEAWVDSLFGTGLSRAPSGDVAALIRRINRDHGCGARVFAADIPSGLNGGTGRAFDPCVHADHTVTFEFLKTGLKLADGLDVCGKITVAGIGFPHSDFGPFDARLIDPADLSGHLPSRPRNIHKGNCGHLLIVAGSLGMAGAAAMCAMAALRSGAGLVSVACVRSIVPILQALVPGAMCVPLEEQDGAIAASAVPRLCQALADKDAVVIGCGLSRRAAPEIVRAVLESGLPAVVDADALNLISATPELLPLLRLHHILTPHPGEAGRLLGESVALDDPVAAAQALHLLGATALYKGAACVICGDGETFVSASGDCGMARGGSGDILAGILGALIAEPSPRTPALSAALASELHGLAGELAQARYGSRAMNARDILEFLPEVFPR